MSGWSTPFQKNENGETRDLEKRTAVVGGTIREVWVVPDEVKEQPIQTVEDDDDGA